MGVAVAKSNPNRLYAIAANASGDFLGFWTSTNAGDSWTQITNTSYLYILPVHLRLVVRADLGRPGAAQHVFVAGVPMLETLNAGGSWRRNSSSFHVDQHAMAWDPGGRVGSSSATTAGSTVAANGSLTGSWTKSTSPVNQFYTVAVSRQDISRISGGCRTTVPCAPGAHRPGTRSTAATA